MRGQREFPDTICNAVGDVLTHEHSHFDYQSTASSQSSSPPFVHVSTMPNPSHLEAAMPTVLGKARARAQTRRWREKKSCLYISNCLFILAFWLNFVTLKIYKFLFNFIMELSNNFFDQFNRSSLSEEIMAHFRIFFSRNGKKKIVELWVNG